MQLGIHLPHIGRKAGPESIRRAAIQAEQLGFDDVWVSEHIIVPQSSPYPPSPNFWDPVVTLTWAAAVTSRVRLGTSVLVLPLRHPLPLAKELATLQNLSQGRLILGAGVGWLEAEFDALGVPFQQRGRRMDEGIAMMRAVWSDDPVTFEARWIPARIDTMRSQPLPVVPIPIWIGGGSDAALRRALRQDGWHGSRVPPDKAAALVRRLRAERPEPGFTISLRVSCNAANVGGMRDTLAAYRDAGVQHVMAAPEDRGLEDYLATAEAFRRAGDRL
ncbi:TIGR03619 family F420-dependent LLM class oxidoreductase [Rhodopila sp.]|uniref:TIGR03619 family F420-dependent LLM class oxidoreductase n=1 Tax=Rhodopila sp. TaxID=2480087 RepID=UPI002C917305|nr:TIGR03619 family F420-dependent LLM class oxidoreductase [Rhodopila sp.]HVZ10179.1 TIGR03619 family F420-dependent LLM class oxidoreductase [Rhodopila sp.]